MKNFPYEKFQRLRFNFCRNKRTTCEKFQHVYEKYCGNYDNQNIEQPRTVKKINQRPKLLAFPDAVQPVDQLEQNELLSEKQMVAFQNVAVKVKGTDKTRAEIEREFFNIVYEYCENDCIYQLVVKNLPDYMRLWGFSSLGALIFDAQKRRGVLRGTKSSELPPWEV